jgi:hypothetical protein
MPKQSRYSDALPFGPDPSGRSSFKGLLPRPITDAPGAVEHTIVAGTRLDHLSLGYFNDDRQWWRIMDANPGLLCATDMAVELSDTQQANDPFGRVHMVGRRVIVPPKG